MTSKPIPQTRTVMEAGFTLREGIEQSFWRANDAAIPTAAAISVWHSLAPQGNRRLPGTCERLLHSLVEAAVSRAAGHAELPLSRKSERRLTPA